MILDEEEYLLAEHRCDAHVEGGMSRNLRSYWACFRQPSVRLVSFSRSSLLLMPHTHTAAIMGPLYLRY